MFEIQVLGKWYMYTGDASHDEISRINFSLSLSRTIAMVMSTGNMLFDALRLYFTLFLFSQSLMAD